MTNSGPFEILICSICRKRIAVETGNTDEYGNAVHEACYISRVTAQTGADLTGFIVVQRVNRTPSLASCARCERKFFTPTSYYGDPYGAEQYLRGKFNLHKCPEA